MKSVIIIGSGIAGLVAAIEAHHCGSNVLIIEKEPKPGGNSLKATSGISICTDSSKIPLFVHDTLSSGHGNPQLVKLLARESTKILPWLQQFDIVLPIVSQCGGHSEPRTFTNEGNVNVGTYIVDKVLDYINNVGIPILLNTRVIDVDKHQIVLENCTIPFDALIIATGGFSNNSSLIPYNLPTTNGSFATGDGLYLGTKLGGQLIDMDKIQIHPTFFVKCPILAPEALRACGGILINRFGHRFIDELQPRDVIVSAWPKDNFVWIVLNQNAITKFGQEKFDFYLSKNIFKKIRPKGQLYNTLISVEMISNENQPVWIARVQPAVHYTMGGLKIDSSARVIGTKIPIFAVGEVTGGIHGKNRLAGNSLLETIVFGRIAGKNASK